MHKQRGRVKRSESSKPIQCGKVPFDAEEKVQELKETDKKQTRCSRSSKVQHKKAIEESFQRYRAWQANIVLATLGTTEEEGGCKKNTRGAYESFIAPHARKEKQGRRKVGKRREGKRRKSEDNTNTENHRGTEEKKEGSKMKTTRGNSSFTQAFSVGKLYIKGKGENQTLEMMKRHKGATCPKEKKETEQGGGKKKKREKKSEDNTDKGKPRRNPEDNAEGSEIKIKATPRQLGTTRRPVHNQQPQRLL
ncbi:hypothetical protein GALMADRAFT_215186 [Galerina marginata CBS 339.88]|uniref:Uncharacterized protein n=1 Tax=Galerina marginata (strain CBS 339.88) TaxID=685588 RepID=A0A067SHQ2_GALM3|nr:hypothetical protein GALMADRAFT_215186 [Galerina marginata CBS 339.88]